MPATVTPSRVKEIIINAAIGLIATLFVTFGTGIWASKESVIAHNADMAMIREAMDSIRNEQRTSTLRILDAICQQKDERHVCR